ncbi:hypothetical protein [Clostridium estertheticum]|uniref:hypothetical protein n=1 Tax=Clostridium estertheticum TaxID=238834 RepID=UPI002161C774|nr:hypothetical protein [Clostridium estertheticum]
MNQTVNLKEWDSIILKDIELPDNDTRDIAKSINNKGIIEIIELKDGLSISSNSYVGRINHHLEAELILIDFVVKAESQRIHCLEITLIEMKKIY